MNLHRAELRSGVLNSCGEFRRGFALPDAARGLEPDDLPDIVAGLVEVLQLERGEKARQTVVVPGDRRESARFAPAVAADVQTAVGDGFAFAVEPGADGQRKFQRPAVGEFSGRNHFGAAFPAGIEHKAVFAGIVVQPEVVRDRTVGVHHDFAQRDVAAIRVEIDLDGVVAPEVGVIVRILLRDEFRHFRLKGFNAQIKIFVVVGDFKAGGRDRLGFAAKDGEIFMPRQVGAQHGAGLAETGHQRDGKFRRGQPECQKTGQK